MKVAQNTDSLKGDNNMGLQKPIVPDPGVSCSIGTSALQPADIIVDDARSRSQSQSQSRDFALGAYRIGGASW